MPWKETAVKETRHRFIFSIYEDNASFGEVCEAFGISRKTGYKWKNIFEEHGKEGLEDRSRKPLSRPRDTSDEQKAAIIQMQLRFSKWGAKKIKSRLEKEAPEIKWPSVTTVGKILKKEGFTTKRRRRFPFAGAASLEDCNAPNDVWSADFKGWWLTQDERICEPLTIFDGYSRYLLCCQHTKRRGLDYIWGFIRETFEEYGMPLRFRTDNGSPFATRGLGRFSALAVKLLRLGITPEWTRPGKPQDNGRHERMHRTLNLEAVNPPAKNLRLQQDALNRFRYEYNQIRPHEALEMHTPAEVHQKSRRKWTGEERDPIYTDEYVERRIDGKGSLYWGGQRIFATEVLKREVVGIIQVYKDVFEVYYGPILLGRIDPIKGFTRA